MSISFNFESNSSVVDTYISRVKEELSLPSNLKPISGKIQNFCARGIGNASISRTISLDELKDVSLIKVILFEDLQKVIIDSAEKIDRISWSILLKRNEDLFVMFRGSYSTSIPFSYSVWTLDKEAMLMDIKLSRDLPVLKEDLISFISETRFISTAHISSTPVPQL